MPYREGDILYDFTAKEDGMNYDDIPENKKPRREELKKEDFHTLYDMNDIENSKNKLMKLIESELENVPGNDPNRIFIGGKG